MPTVQSVARAVLLNMYNHAWNTAAATKVPHSSSYTLNTGGMFINYDQSINWSSYDANTQVNQASSGATILAAGLTQLNNHDPQVCMMYVRAVVLYKLAFPSDTTFDLPNGSGYMGISDLVDHLTTLDFAPQTNNGNGGYNNPKGWIYFGLLDIYLGLLNSSLITGGQKTALKNSTLYAAFTYMNSWLDTTTSIFDNEKHITYQPSQSLLMAAAVLDAAARWNSDIAPGMFYDSAPYGTQTAAGWTAVANACATNVLTRGAFTNIYGLHFGVMNVVDGMGSDTVNSYVVKSDDISETAQALIRLYQLTGTASYLTQADAILAAIDKYFLDTQNGGYYTSFDLSKGTTNTAYKETRATSHMADSYNWRNTVGAATNNSNIAKMLFAVDTLTNPNKFYKTTGNTGFWYRTKGDSTFGMMTDNYTPAFSSTLAHSVSIGDTSVQTTAFPGPKSTTNCYTSIPGAGSYTCQPDSMVNIGVGTVVQIQDGSTEAVTVASVTSTTFTATFVNAHTTVPYVVAAPLADTIMILNYGGGDEECITLHCQGTTGTGPYTIPVNASANGGTGQFQKNHSNGEAIQSMLFPIDLTEDEYTTEAMSNVCAYLMHTLTQPSAAMSGPAVKLTARGGSSKVTFGGQNIKRDQVSLVSQPRTLPPVEVGDAPGFPLVIEDKYGNALNLTGLGGSDISMMMKNEATGVRKVAIGSFGVTDAANGKIEFGWSPLDTTVAGIWKCCVVLGWNSGVNPQSCDVAYVQINAA